MASSRAYSRLEELRASRRNSASETGSVRDAKSRSPGRRSGRESPSDELNENGFGASGNDLEKSIQTMGVIRHLRGDLQAAQTALAFERRRVAELQEMLTKVRHPRLVRPSCTQGTQPSPSAFTGVISLQEANEALIQSLSRELEDLKNFKAKSMAQISSLKQTVEDDGSSRKTIDSLTEQNLELKKKVRRMESSLSDFEANRDVLMSLDESQKRELAMLKKSVDSLETKLASAHEENSRLERNLQIEKTTAERYKIMVESMKEQTDVAALAPADIKGLNSLEIAKLKRSMEAATAQSRTLSLQLELQIIANNELQAKVERIDAMSGKHVNSIFAEELRWLANDVILMAGISKAGIAFKQLLSNLASLGTIGDEHQLYAAALRVSVHVEIGVELLRALCLALLAAGTLLYSPPNESSDFVPLVSALADSSKKVCSRLESDGELNSKDAIQKVIAITSKDQYRYLDNLASQGASDSLADTDAYFVWETLVQIAYYVAAIEAMTVGSKHFLRLAETNVVLPREVRQACSVGQGLTDALIGLCSSALEDASDKRLAGKSALGDASWRSNGISKSNLMQIRNDALSSLQRFSGEYSLLDKEVNARSKPLTSEDPSYSIIELSTLTSLNKALENTHADLSRVMSYVKKVGIRLPHITDIKFCWGLLSEGISFDVVESTNAVKTFVASPCHWRSRVEKISQRLENVFTKENTLKELETAASQSTSLVDKSKEELTAALNRCAELDQLLNVYVEKTALLEQAVKGSTSSSSQLEALEKENKVQYITNFRVHN